MADLARSLISAAALVRPGCSSYALAQQQQQQQQQQQMHLRQRKRRKRQQQQQQANTWLHWLLQLCSALPGGIQLQLVDLAQHRVEMIKIEWMEACTLQSQLDDHQQQQLHSRSLRVHQRTLATWPELQEFQKILHEQRLPDGFQFQGSARDFWGFQEASDLDLVKWWSRHKGPQVCNSKESPGYCQLRAPASAERLTASRGGGWLHGRQLPASSLVTRVCSPGRFRRQMLRSIADNWLSGTALHEHGPAVTQTRSFGNGDSRDVDLVCSQRLSKWPRFLLAEWLPRHRRRFAFSPGKSKIHVVPIGSCSDGGTHCWRYSYHEVESSIFGDLAPTEAACYALMKKLHHLRLKRLGYRSYQVKMAFLWLRLLEPSCTWQQPAGILAAAVRGVLLVQLCAARACMPNYFMPVENVVRHQPEQSEQLSAEQIADQLSEFVDSELPLTAMSPQRLQTYLRELGGGASPKQSPAEFGDDCYCSFDLVTGRSLEADCGDCDRLLRFDSCGLAA